MTKKGDSSGRDARGRFTAGNAGGPGGSRKRMLTLRRAAAEAITEEHIEAMIRKATRLALEGNLTAMRLVFDRTCGRIPDASVEPEAIEVELPRLRTAADCNAAIDRVLAGVVEGTLDRDAAKLLMDAIQARVKVIEVTEIEERLVKLEEATQAVDQTAGRRSGRR